MTIREEINKKISEVTDEVVRQRLLESENKSIDLHDLVYLTDIYFHDTWFEIYHENGNTFLLGSYGLDDLELKVSYNGGEFILHCDTHENDSTVFDLDEKIIDSAEVYSIEEQEFSTIYTIEVIQKDIAIHFGLVIPKGN